MGVSYNWLKEYIACPWEAKELADRLTSAGIAVDQVEAVEDDFILELDLTPNRGDCLGMINLAYEVSALCGQPVKFPVFKPKENLERAEDYMKIRLDDPEACPRFTGRIIKNVRIASSPAWMQQHLIRSGIRPINNIVDITNYVMLEMNQPMHAYDYDFFIRKEIVVRSGFEGKSFITLDGSELVLQAKDLLITEAGDRPVGLAGIMGGENSQVLDETHIIFLEAASFERTGIRKTSRRLNLRSDASMRFEKGCDVSGVTVALDRAAYLMQELAEGEVVGGILDVYPNPAPVKTIYLRPDRVNQVLGIELAQSEVIRILNSLRMKIVEKEDGLEVVIPTYRSDLELEVDLIEEVARLYGYDNIPSAFPVGQVTAGGMSDYQIFKDRLRAILSETMQEVINYSFISPQAFDSIALAPDSALRNAIRLANPLSEEQSVMRTLLMPGMLEIVARNAARQNNNLAFFEIGNIFYPSDSKQFQPAERVKLAGVLSGRTTLNWVRNDRKMDYYYGKGILDSLFQRLGIHPIYTEALESYYHPGRSACICCQGQVLGSIGEIHPEVMKNYGLKTPVCAFELEVEQLFKLCDPVKTVRAFSKFPAVERDLAILVDSAVTAQSILQCVKDLAIPHFTDITLFDIYAGEQVPDGYKSVAVNLVFQSYEQTLTDKEVTAAMETIARSLSEQLSAQIRVG